MNTWTTLDPWSNGQTSFRVVVTAGMCLNGAGIMLIIVGLILNWQWMSYTGMAVLGAGMITHLVGVGMRIRFAKKVVRARAAAEEETRNT